MADAATSVEVAASGRIWSPGDPVDTLYVVRRGAVKVWRPVDDDRDRVVHLGLHARGAVLGGGPLLYPDWASRQRVDAAEAWGEAAVYRVPAASVVAAAEVSAPFALALGRLAEGRASRLERRLGVLLHRTAESRLAALFLALADDFGVRDSRGVIIDLRLTHREMASLVGVSRETVSVSLLDLRKRKLVAVESKRVVLLDVDALTSLARGEGA
jgi:CRP-like cAMP-binding protein